MIQYIRILLYILPYKLLSNFHPSDMWCIAYSVKCIYDVQNDNSKRANAIYHK